MTEYEKMEQGQLYDPGDEDIMREQRKYQDGLWAVNQLKPTNLAAKEKYMKETFASCGDHCYIEQPFYANWGGRNVHFGSGVYANFNLVLVDDGNIYVGDRVMIGPNVTIATANHPLEPELRAKGLQINRDVVIGENVWLGAGVIIVPGVTIGKNAVIGAGSVVTKDIPDNVLAVGNPARVIRKIESKND